MPDDFAPAYFAFPKLLTPPILRAAYSDRTSWLMCEMSRLAYVLFEQDAKPLVESLSIAGFELLQTFNSAGTQAFLAINRLQKIAVLSFRGTQTNSLSDIKTDLNFRLTKISGAGGEISAGFYNAFEAVRADIKIALDKLEDNVALYFTGHSLGGALAITAANLMARDNLAAVYTFGSPRVGRKDADVSLKIPVYRLINDTDVVPNLPPMWLLKYVHYGEPRYIVLKNGRPMLQLEYPFWARFWSSITDPKGNVGDHNIAPYSQRLAQIAEDRFVA
jgi:hypothetical protein